jgi:hypothetical protein
VSAYEVAFHAKAAGEVRGLPERPGKALWDTLAAVRRDPWAVTLPDRLVDDEAFRFVLFDDGDGVAHLLINDTTRTVTVHGISWIG